MTNVLAETEVVSRSLPSAYTLVTQREPDTQVLLLLLGFRSASESTFNLGVGAAVADGEVDVSVDFVDSARTIDHLRGTGLLAVST